jgi:hypothetical protein
MRVAAILQSRRLTFGEQVNVQRKQRADLLRAIALPELELLAQGGLDARWCVGGGCGWSGEGAGTKRRNQAVVGCKALHSPTRMRLKLLSFLPSASNMAITLQV